MLKSVLAGGLAAVALFAGANAGHAQEKITYLLHSTPGNVFWQVSGQVTASELAAGANVLSGLDASFSLQGARTDFTVVVAARGHSPAVFENGLTVRPDDPPLTRIADVRLEPR